MHQINNKQGIKESNIDIWWEHTCFPPLTDHTEDNKRSRYRLLFSPSKFRHSLQKWTRRTIRAYFGVAQIIRGHVWEVEFSCVPKELSCCSQFVWQQQRRSMGNYHSHLSSLSPSPSGLISCFIFLLILQAGFFKSSCSFFCLPLLLHQIIVY